MKRREFLQTGICSSVAPLILTGNGKKKKECKHDWRMPNSVDVGRFFCNTLDFMRFVPHNKKHSFVITNSIPMWAKEKEPKNIWKMTPDGFFNHAIYYKYIIQIDIENPIVMYLCKEESGRVFSWHVLGIEPDWERACLKCGSEYKDAVSESEMKKMLANPPKTLVPPSGKNPLERFYYITSEMKTKWG